MAVFKKIRLILQCGEIWSFAGSKKKKVWTWPAIDRDSRKIADAYVGSLSRKGTCETDGGRKTGSVRSCHDPAPFAALCPAGDRPPFSGGNKTAVCKCLADVHSAALMRICGQLLSNTTENPGIHPLLESPAAGLARRMSVCQAFPRRPVRSTHKMPFTASRGSRGLRLRESFLHIDCEMTGSNLLHCLPVISML
jgi:hypothetical protein